MPKKTSNPHDPEIWTGDIVWPVRLEPDERVAIESLHDGIDCSRGAVLRALVRLGLATAGDHPELLVPHLVRASRA